MLKGDAVARRVILKSFGIRWRKARNNRNILVEKRMVEEQMIYLTALERYKDSILCVCVCVCV
jgi:hypothetical protein